MPRISTKTNIKPQKVYIKDIEKWEGKSVNVILSQNDALLLAEGLIKALQKTKRIDLTIFPKLQTPTITITYQSNKKLIKNKFEE